MIEGREVEAERALGLGTSEGRAQTHPRRLRGRQKLRLLLLLLERSLKWTFSPGMTQYQTLSVDVFKVKKCPAKILTLIFMTQKFSGVQFHILAYFTLWWQKSHIINKNYLGSYLVSFSVSSRKSGAGGGKKRPPIYKNDSDFTDPGPARDTKL